MRRQRAREALVIDEYGGTAGLVTFESLMERIVGKLGGDFGTAVGVPSSVSRTDRPRSTA